MLRTSFAVMIAVGLSAPVAMADTPSAVSGAAAPSIPGPTDATTPMDTQLGNEQPPVDNTLSNAEVMRLKTQQMVAPAQVPQGEVIVPQGQPLPKTYEEHHSIEAPENNGTPE